MTPAIGTPAVPKRIAVAAWGVRYLGHQEMARPRPRHYLYEPATNVTTDEDGQP